ncbi:hypothetical protein CBR64_00120 [Cellulosimicrobium cellulans]|uniref:Uncharacterized protein n=1 Tax=Cellulosimicrobium cellulans TaxID=1710 RepID=A0A1Y0HPV0_CELCE|nr:hypothetical protein [Cellulosimicrobium cellulans]ARU50157.1 hypothetical protein CBR64_00120 [Cellulosimicrobium cellulans]
MTFSIDRSSSSEISICACGWRALELDHLQLLRAMRHHEIVAHPGEDHARKMLKSYGYVQRHAALGLFDS